MQYGPADEGKEWRVPRAANLQQVRAAYSAGAAAFQLAASGTAAPCAAASSTSPLLPIAGDVIEVEVEADDGGASPVWKPAKVINLLPVRRPPVSTCFGGCLPLRTPPHATLCVSRTLPQPARFVVCVNGEGDFLEEYGLDDEGTEWRRPVPADCARVKAAWRKAEAAWAETHQAGTWVEPGERWVIERIISQRRLPRARHLEYFVKWAGYDSDQNTWEVSPSAISAALTSSQCPCLVGAR